MSGQPQNISWQAWVLVTVLVAFIGALPGLYSEFNKIQNTKDSPGKNQSSSTPTPTPALPTQTAPLDLSGKHAGVIKSTIKASRIAVSDAYTTGRTDVLSQYFSGSALIGYINVIQKTHDSGEYAIYEVKDLKFDRISVDSDELGATAEVSTSERFIYYYLDAREKCSRYTNFVDYSFTFTLNRIRDGWIIDKHKVTHGRDDEFKC